jgi:ribosome-associated protein
MLYFELEEDQPFIQLNSLLKIMQLVETGGEANIRISDGEVRLNGALETQKRKKVKSGDVITFGKAKITVK